MLLMNALPMKSLALLLLVCAATADAATIVIGQNQKNDNEEQSSSFGDTIGWRDGACYLPIANARVGDVLEFRYSGGHNVYKLEDRRAYRTCSFRNAQLLADANDATGEPYLYTITEEDLGDSTTDDNNQHELYFACRIGSHCAGQQKLMVKIDAEATEPRERDPASNFALGASASACELVQRGDAEATLLDRAMESSCSDPVQLDASDDPYHRPWMFTSCLSPPMTLTPGGVVNQATVLHFPYPTDRRVVMGTRLWEFVQGDSIEQVQPVNVNQLYVHHILSGIVLGNGAESIRRSDEDAAFPPPYGRLSGDQSDISTFHLLDLRNVTEWLECIECRCRDENGTALEVGGAGEREAINNNDDDDDDDDDLAGGISCCSNCTDLQGPTIDYRLRYNVTYMDIDQFDAPVLPIIMLAADIAPALGKSIEFDVPKYTDLPNRQRLPTDPTIQVLERVGKFRDLFRHGFFAQAYHGPDTVEIHRCTGHMHVGAVEQWLEDAATGQVICHSQAVYGTDPTADEGFLTKLTVRNYGDAKAVSGGTDHTDGPLIIAADQRLRMITHYNASVVHTGVMGMFFLFVSEQVEPVTPDKAALKVDVCSSTACNASMLPRTDDIPVCQDVVSESFLCSYLQICDCEALLALDEVVGGCDGVLVTPQRNMSVNRFCEATCGCKHLEQEGAKEEMKRQGMETAMEDRVTSLCHYSTPDCREYLNNLYACAADQPGADELDDVLRTMMAQKGRRMALNHAKLGDPTIHRFEPVVVDEYAVPMCPSPLGSLASPAFSTWSNHSRGWFGVVFVAVSALLLLA